MKFETIRTHTGATVHMGDGLADVLAWHVAAAVRDERASRPVLVVADGPWTYRNRGAGLNGTAAAHYETGGVEAVADDLRLAYEIAEPNARLLLWITWPIVVECLTSKGAKWLDEDRVGWRALSGGHRDTDPRDLDDDIEVVAWRKTSGTGIGFHWRGDGEPAILFVKPGKGRRINDRSVFATNCYAGDRTDHSEKNSAHLATLIRKWTRPGDTILDLYGGLAPTARAVHAVGDRVLWTTEPDDKRRREALDALAAASRRVSLLGALGGA